MASRNFHCERNGKHEIAFMIAQMQKEVSLGAGYAAPTKLTRGGLEYYVLSFGQGDKWFEQFHLSHGVDFSKCDGLVDFDLHFEMSAAQTGQTIKMKVSLWHIYEGRVLANLGATGDVTYTASIASKASDPSAFDDAYVEDAMDLSGWDTNRSIHDGIGIKLERLASGDGDDYSGNFYLHHGELWLPTNGRLSSRA